MLVNGSTNYIITKTLLSNACTGREWTPSRDIDVDVGDSGDILLPKPATPQPNAGKMDRKKEGKSKREQEEEERDKMQLVPSNF